MANQVQGISIILVHNNKTNCLVPVVAGNTPGVAKDAYDKWIMHNLVDIESGEWDLENTVQTGVDYYVSQDT